MNLKDLQVDNDMGSESQLEQIISEPTSEKKTLVEGVEKTKRNHQKQILHLENIRAKKQDMKRRNQSFKNPEGRPSKAEIVADWRQAHPDGKKIDCEQDTGLSRHTVLKWWESNKENNMLVAGVKSFDEENNTLIEENKILSEKIKMLDEENRMLNEENKKLLKRIDKLTKKINGGKKSKGKSKKSRK